MKKLTYLFQSVMNLQLALIRPLVRRSGPINLGALDRTEPISTDFGYERGVAIDRYYIDAFLSENKNDIKGRTLIQNVSVAKK